MRWRLKLNAQASAPQDGATIDVQLLRIEDGSRFTFKVGDEEVTLRDTRVHSHSIETQNLKLMFERSSPTLWRACSQDQLYILEPDVIDAIRGGKADVVHSLMPGRILKILCQVGDQVQEGQALMVIEAMKMENEIRSPRAAIVKEIAVSPQQSIESGALLISFNDEK